MLIFYLGLLEVKCDNQLGTTRLVAYLSCHIQHALVEELLNIFTYLFPAFYRGVKVLLEIASNNN